MNNKLTLAVTALFVTLTTSAQLKVNYIDSGVVVGDTSLTSSKARLTVNNCNLFQAQNFNIGIASSPVVDATKVNSGVDGVIVRNAAHSPDSNYGLRGYVRANYYDNYCRNFGTAGIFFGPENCGGAGILGSVSYLGYVQGPSLSGTYAGYFDGPVNMTGTLTVPNVNTTSDIRLKDNVISIQESEDNRGRALDNVLNMNVLEYNLKEKPIYDLTTETYATFEKEHPDAVEDMKRRSVEFTSKRHFGLSAQELQVIYPNLVEEGQDGYLSVNYVELVPILIRSIQELKQEVDELKGIAVSKGAAMISESVDVPDDKSYPITTYQQSKSSYTLNVNGRAVGAKLNGRVKK